MAVNRFISEHIPQMSKRRDFNAFDQWGRMWLLQIEKATFQAAGAIEACFTDPMNTPMKYLSVPEGRLNTIVIDYPQWIRDLEQANREYDDRAADVAHQLYGEGFARALKRRPPELLRIIGRERPMDPEIVRKAMDGDRVLLGLEPAPAPVAPTPKAPRRRKAEAVTP